MPNIVVVFASLNQVALLRRALNRQGVFVDLLRTPHCLSATGCSFALRCAQSELPAIEEQCLRLTISYGGIFEEVATTNGVEYQALRPGNSES